MKKIQMISIVAVLTTSALLCGCNCMLCTEKAKTVQTAKKHPGSKDPVVNSKQLLDPVFSSNMVLQQKKPIAFFGYAGANVPVKVEFAGKTVDTKANEEGFWRAEFPAMKAGHTNYTVKVTASKQTVVLKDILIGDVWFCSGQSNMQMPIGAKFSRGWSVQNCEQEVRNARWPEIRYVQQKCVSSHHKRLPAVLDVNPGWVKTSPKVAPKFSATAYFFGRKLYKDLNIPIGLISSNWGGTEIRPWISREGYEAAKLDYELAFLRKFDFNDAEKKAYEQKEDARFCKEIKEFDQKMAAAGTKKREACAVFASPDFNDKDWKKAASHYVPKGTTEINWYRTAFRLLPDMRNDDLILKFGGDIAQAADFFLNGKKIAGWTAADLKLKRTTQIKLKANQFNQNGDNVLAVRAIHYYDDWKESRRMYILITRTRLDGSKKVMQLLQWKQKQEFRYDYAKAKVKLPANHLYPYTSLGYPCNLYNSMVHPWTALPIKGVIWYQGCSDAGSPRYYLKHKALIADWRSKWNDPEMPFIIAQLAGYGDSNWQKTQPKDGNYSLTRDIQLQMMLEDPNVGLACLIDIGEPANIHPANKQDVGYRLALEAERIAYGKKIVSRGPLFKKAEVKGSTICVSFDNAEGLKTVDGKSPAGFAIAGADKKFVWADARIEGKTVVVSSPKVPAPKYVRYAYAAYRGDLNLQNKQGLPAYPFRSDPYDYKSLKRGY